jgi:hypothetical protein
MVTCAVLVTAVEPDRETACVPAPSAMVSVPVVVPLACGVKVTLIVQLPLAAMLEPQVLVSPNAVVVVMLEMATAELVPFESVTVCAALVVLTATPVKESDVGEAETLALVPERLTVWGLPLALSAILSVPVAGLLGGSRAVGVKITLIVQVEPAAMPVPQVLVWAKTALLMEMPEKVKVAVPVLETVTDCGALATPTPVEKVRLETERLTPGVPVLVFVLLEPPPQQVKSAKPRRTAKKRLKFAAESDMEFIAPPPASGWAEPGRAQRHARGRTCRGQSW